MTLLEELNAEEGSFLLELRTNLAWNHHSFVKFLLQLEEYCVQNQNEANLNRAYASEICYISHFVKEWSTHEGFKSIQSEAYFELAYQLIHDLSYHYFIGESVYNDSLEVANKIEKLTFLSKG